MKKPLTISAIAILLCIHCSAQFYGIPPPHVNKPFCVRHFNWPEVVTGEKVWLRFGLMDRNIIVYLNGKIVGSHACGYIDFKCDITARLRAGENEVVIVGEDNREVWDHSWLEKH